MINMTELESLVIELRLFSLSHKKSVSYFNEVCYLIENALGIPEEFLIRKQKKEEIVEARQIGMFLLLNGEYSLKQIADFFNINNHTTVMHARDKVYSATEKNNLKFYNKLKLFGIK